MQNAWLDEAQPGIKIAGRNINNLRYVGDTTLMAKSKEELKSLLSSVTQSCPTLCDPMNCGTLVFHVHCQLLELAQLMYMDGDAIQPSHPL